MAREPKLRLAKVMTFGVPPGRVRILQPRMLPKREQKIALLIYPISSSEPPRES